MWVTRLYPFTRGVVGKNSKTMRKLAEYENNRQWQDVFNRLVSLACNLFEWENTPETCDMYFFEQTLLWTARACVIDDKEKGGILSLPVIPASSMNIYYENTYMRAVSVEYSKQFRAVTHYNKNIDLTILDDNITETLGVVCYDNIQQYPLIETIMMYTDKIVDAMRAIDVAAKQLKIPALIETDEDNKASVQLAVENIDQNVIAVIGKSKLTKTLSESKQISTGAAPQNLEMLWKHIHNLWSEALTALGINNMNSQDKKERLITDEVNSNNDFVKQNINYRLDMRKHFCENYKACFGTEIDVKIRHDEDMNNELLYNDPLGRNENRGISALPTT